MSWRDKFGVLGAGTFAERPAASADIEEMLWFVIEGTTNLGKIYVVNDGAWVLIPLDEWLSLEDHDHDDDYAPTPHGNEHHTEVYLTSVDDDDTDRASAVGASHSVKAKTAALADDSSLLNSRTSLQIMLMAAEVFG